MLIATSQQLNTILEFAAKVALVDGTILISGEEGVGRETLARYIHEHSNRATGPFIIVDIAGRPASLVDAELLGVRKGAFTGASTDREGLLRLADSGTLLLKNVQDIPFEKQSLLLRYLQEREVTPIGSLRPYPVNVRVIATASEKLEEHVQQGHFRQDLYYRLNVFPLHIPPLRSRPDDILPLAEAFLGRFGGQKGLTAGARRELQLYPWPGNVRELSNTIMRAQLVATGETIDVPELALGPLPKARAANSSSGLQQEVLWLKTELEAISRSSISASPIWEGRRFATEPDLCFVLMPFADTRDLQRVYTDHVKPAVESTGLRCQRADDIHDISGVMQSVWEGINRAKLIIADMTERNPNVFYELGIAHTLGKPVIMITQSMDYVPFDLKHLRCIVYDYKPVSIDRLEAALKKTIGTVLETRADGLAITR